MSQLQPFINFLYSGSDTTPLSTILFDLDMIQTIPNGNICKIIDDINTDTGFEFKYYRTMKKYDRHAITTVFDKLTMSQIVDTIVKRYTTSRKRMPASTQIINHTLNNADIITAYVHSHRPLCNNAAIATRNMHDAVLHGMHIKKLKIHDCDIIQDCYIDLCTSLAELDIANRDYDFCLTRYVTTLAPFAKSLKTLYADSSRCIYIDDITLQPCTMIEELHACRNRKITTCAPFAKSLKRLFANGCGMTDAGISMCTMIEELHANSNTDITTCVPFSFIFVSFVQVEPIVNVVIMI